MREIRFRAWDKANNRMLYTDWNSPHNWYTESKLGKVAYERRFDGEQIQLSEPEQLVPGIRDKHGKDAYEGDRLWYGAEHDVHIYGVVRFGKIPDNSGNKRHIGFYVEWEGERKSVWHNDIGYWLPLTEVCGNEHDSEE